MFHIVKVVVSVVAVVVVGVVVVDVSTFLLSFLVMSQRWQLKVEEEDVGVVYKIYNDVE